MKIAAVLFAILFSSVATAGVVAYANWRRGMTA